jgi:ankyrin repeat protein
LSPDSLPTGKESNGGSSASDAVIGLLQHGADLEAQDNHGNTLLLTAIRERATNVALELLRLGANAKATNEYGQNTLHLVAMYRPNQFQNLLDGLIAAKVDVNARDKFGATPVEVAVGLDHGDVADYLRANGK